MKNVIEVVYKADAINANITETSDYYGHVNGGWLADGIFDLVPGCEGSNVLSSIRHTFMHFMRIF